MERYLACLEKEPEHSRALTRMAEIYCRRGEYEKGLEYATHVLTNVKYDPDANYIYGVISRYIGNYVDARETFGWAARSLKYRSNAYCQMAEIYIKEQNYLLARDYALKALDFNVYNLKIYEVLAIVNRKLAEPLKAEESISKLLEKDPLNHLARFELYLLKQTPEKLNKFKTGMSAELPWEHYLEIALFYEKLGLSEEAYSLLEQAPEYPVIYYWMAYLIREADPSGSFQFLEKANSMSPELVFPFREETIDVLKWCLKTTPGEWKLNYYLGLIYWNKGRYEEALQLLNNCNNADYAPLYLALGSLDKANAADYYKKARNIDPGNWQPWHYLIRLYNSNLKYNEAFLLSEKATKSFPENLILVMDHAGSLYNVGSYNKCLELLNSVIILPYEGGWEAHNLFKNVQIRLAIKNMKTGDFIKALEYLEGSKEYPERLGTGKPYNPDYRLQDYLKTVCYHKMGENKKADELKKLLYDYTINNWNGNLKNSYFGFKCLQEFGDTERESELLTTWERSGNSIYQWYYVFLQENWSEVSKRRDILINNPRYGIIIDVIEFIEEFK